MLVVVVEGNKECVLWDVEGSYVKIWKGKVCCRW